MPAISVIIPTFRHRNYVLQTLASVFAQSFHDYEVIVVNDGSPDDTGDVLRPLAELGRIRYFEQENGGQGAARNRGLAEARGEFVALLDDDDIWPSDKLAWQVEELRASPWAAVGGVTGFIVDGQRTIVTEAEAFEFFDAASMYHGNPFHSPGQVLVRRSALDAVGGFDRSIWGADDLDFWMRLAGEGPVARRGRCALYYRIHASNASRAVARMFWNSRTVLKKNLPLVPPAGRRDAVRAGHRWLHGYVGSAVIRGMGSWRSADVVQGVRVLGCLALPCARDPVLAKKVLSDLCPRVVRRAAGALRARSTVAPVQEIATIKT